MEAALVALSASVPPVKDIIALVKSPDLGPLLDDGENGLG